MGEVNQVYLALDQGTHSSRSMVLNESGTPLETFQQSVALNRISEDEIEQDATELLQALQQCLASSLEFVDKNDMTIVAAGLATQRSSVLAWDRKSGEALTPILSWQDRRAWQDIELLRDIAPFIRKHTGLPLTPHYGASKIRWLRDEFLPKQKTKAKKIGFGPLASYLIANLVDEIPYCVDHTNALRTQLMNLQTLKWDPWLIETFGLSDIKLPECVPVNHSYGKLKGTQIPLTAVSGDQTAAMFAQGNFPPKTALVNLGTGGFILKPCEASAEIDRDLLGGLSFSDRSETRYIHEGTVNGCGAALEWAKVQLEIESDPSESLDGWLRKINDPPLFLNTVGGIGSPFWIGNVEPRWCSLTGEPTTKPDPPTALVAVVESFVFLIFENFRRITRHEPIQDIRISGGLAELDEVCHRLANLTKCRVTRRSNVESTACGVAWLASEKPAKWGGDGEDTVFVPADDESLIQRYDAFMKMLEHLTHQT